MRITSSKIKHKQNNFLKKNFYPKRHAKHVI